MHLIETKEEVTIKSVKNHTVVLNLIERPLTRNIETNALKYQVCIIRRATIHDLVSGLPETI